MSWLVACDEPGCCEVGKVTRTRHDAGFECESLQHTLAALPDGWEITRRARLSRPGDDGLPKHACPAHAAQRDFDEMEAKGR